MSAVLLSALLPVALPGPGLLASSRRPRSLAPIGGPSVHPVSGLEVILLTATSRRARHIAFGSRWHSLPPNRRRG